MVLASPGSLDENYLHSTVQSPKNHKESHKSGYHLMKMRTRKMNLSNSRMFICLLSVILTLPRALTTAEEHDAVTLTSHTSVTGFIPYRYDRLIYFFFSENATVEIFTDILNKLIELDDYCGGENIKTASYFGNDLHYMKQDDFSSLSDIYRSILNGEEDIRVYFNACIAINVSSGSVDHDDVMNISSFLINTTSAIWRDFILNKKAGAITEVILVTDYATNSIGSADTISLLCNLKSQANVNFIVLTANLTNITIYFPGTIWTHYMGYLSWAPDNGTINPICGVHAYPYTTPIPSFNGDLTLHFYLFFSSDYITRTQLVEFFELVTHLSVRRWQYPCRQYRSIKFIFSIPDSGLLVDFQCNVEITEVAAFYNDSCAPDLIRSWFSDPWTNSVDNMTCSDSYEKFYDKFLDDNAQLERNKYLLITDLPLRCTQGSANQIFPVLSNYSVYSTGAPITVIAIDKRNDKNVANSFAPLFPLTQAPNLYAVNNVSELLSNTTSFVNFCLDTAPLLGVVKLERSPRVWYFYLIGGTILTMLTLAFAIFLIRSKIKRQKKMRQMRERMVRGTNTIATTNNFYEYSSVPLPADNWEISQKSLDVNYTTVIGKGAFSIVYAGILHGKAPVLNMFPSIALQQYTDCGVAVKTLPQHSDENNKTKFRTEILLMKEIGYHIHLVCMLGYNCSVERPILVLELAKQNLLNWLITSRSSATESDMSLDKSLLSVSWQVSDGMSYLSSKNFVHRDLAARNVLLNAEMKAMVSDFGLCRKLEDAEQMLTLPGGKLPLKWMALESLQDHQFSLKTDVWSYGVLLFEIFNLGQEPYVQMTGEELLPFLQAENRLSQPKFASNEVYNIMMLCWHVDRKQRPDFATMKIYFAEMLEESAESYGYLVTTEKECNENNEK